MDWSNELYVKLYRRVTDDDLLLSWEARALWHEMLKRFDRSGFITTRRGAPGLAVLVGIPLEVVERALGQLELDGRVKAVDVGFFAPNFMPAQETSKSNRLRQQEVRDKRRMQAVSQLRNGSSQPVIDRHSDLIRSEPSRSEPIARGARVICFSAELERRRIPEEPGVFMVIDDSGSCLGLVRIDDDGNESRES